MKLEKETLIEGARKSLENAKELIEDGTLLFNNGKFARAFTLFQLSMEEVGKSTLMLEALLFGKYKSKRQQKILLRDLRNHKNKTRLAQRIDYLLALTIPNKDLKKTLIKNVLQQSKQIDKINDFKNYSLYTSYINGKFIKPSEKITKSLVEDFKFYAEIRHEATRQLQESIIKDLDAISERFASIDSRELQNNPPEEIKELIELVKNN